MQIGELAEKVGVSTPTVRYYESIGLMPSPGRVSGRRVYGCGDLKRLRAIHSARQVGISIEEVRGLLDGFPKSVEPSKRWSQLAETKLSELDRIIENTKALKILIETGQNCDCDDIALCLNSEGKACYSTKAGTPCTQAAASLPQVLSKAERN